MFRPEAARRTAAEAPLGDGAAHPFRLPRKGLVTDDARVLPTEPVEDDLHGLRPHLRAREARATRRPVPSAAAAADGRGAFPGSRPRPPSEGAPFASQARNLPQRQKGGGMEA
ncbi:hypothetical protein GCM10023329_03910 [Streptomyces sanyensis]|uniref:Uncharacterized protein n=1 Tax=Streptomyces sanyensis TaxID=568869 RepID=A0ABP8ZQC4_9ACTN